MLKSAQRFYKNVTAKDCRIIVIHATDRLLPELSEPLSKVTEKNFAKRGIEVHLNEKAIAVEDEKVILESGLEVEGATIICTIGAAAHNFIADPILPMERGRILTAADMSVEGVTGVWAMGDGALVPNAHSGSLSPPTAQFSDR